MATEQYKYQLRTVEELDEHIGKTVLLAVPGRPQISGYLFREDSIFYVFQGRWDGSSPVGDEGLKLMREHGGRSWACYNVDEKTFYDRTVVYGQEYPFPF
jgi:hypothetical protein